MKSNLTMTDKELKQILNKIDSRLDKIDNRLDNVDNRFDKIDKDLSTLKGQYRNISISLGKLVETQFKLPIIRVRLSLKFKLENVRYQIIKNGRTLGDIDLIYVNERKKSYLFVEIKTGLNCRDIENISNKLIANSLIYLEQNNKMNWKSYYAIAYIDALKENQNCNIYKKAKDNGVALIKIFSQNNIDIYNKELFDK